jgi:S1-C subfamily serine protease
VRRFVTSILGGATRAAQPDWGLALVPLTPALAAQVGFGGAEGVVVSSVAPSSPAARAQLAQGDVITKIANLPVGDVSGAMAIRDRQSASAGTQLVVEFSRRGVMRTATLTN